MILFDEKNIKIEDYDKELDSLLLLIFLIKGGKNNYDEISC